MTNDIERVLISRELIKQRTKELGRKITEDYKDKDLILVCILRGSILFFSELAQEIDLPLIMDFMAVSSYEGGVRTSGVVRIQHDLLENIKDKDVLIVEDIVDSGLTLSYIIENLQSRKPNSIKICTLLDKPKHRIAPVEVDYIGFELPDEFIVGYGLDYKQKYRNLPFIGVLKPEVY